MPRRFNVSIDLVEVRCVTLSILIAALEGRSIVQVCEVLLKAGYESYKKEGPRAGGSISCYLLVLIYMWYIRAARSDTKVVRAIMVREKLKLAPEWEQMMRHPHSWWHLGLALQYARSGFAE
jgi:hypothetical protein